MLKTFVTGWIVFFIGRCAFADPQEISRVEVFSRSHVLLRVFKYPEDRAGFKGIWENKAPVRGFLNLGSWDYLLRVQTKETSFSWRYDTKTGLCTLAGEKKTPLYHVRDFEILNKALQALPHQRILWVPEELPLDLKHEPWIAPYDSRKGRREFRENRGESVFRSREEKKKTVLPDFNPSADTGGEENQGVEDDSRLICISLEEARRRRDASRAKAEASRQADPSSLSGAQ